MSATKGAGDRERLLRLRGALLFPRGRGLDVPSICIRCILRQSTTDSPTSAAGKPHTGDEMSPQRLHRMHWK